MCDLKDKLKSIQPTDGSVPNVSSSALSGDLECKYVGAGNCGHFECQTVRRGRGIHWQTHWGNVSENVTYS